MTMRKTNIKGTKNTIAAKFTHYAAIILERHAVFPMDMLRYDQCSPASETDSAIIVRSVQYLNTTRSVAFVRREYSTSSGRVWTFERWESFGVECIPVTHDEMIDFKRELQSTPESDDATHRIECWRATVIGTRTAAC